MTTEKLLKGMPVLQTQIDTLLEFDVSPALMFRMFSRDFDDEMTPYPFSILSGSSQGAEQRDHQRCIPDSLQGPGQTVRILQRWNHQPIRSVVRERLIAHVASYRFPESV